MKILEVCFFTSIGGDRRSHMALVAVRKVPGRDAYRIKWNFFASLTDPENESRVFPGAGAWEAVKAFVLDEASYAVVEFVGYSEVKLCERGRWKCSGI